MMNNSSSTSDRQTINETDKRHSKIEENEEKLMMPEKSEIKNDGTSDNSIVNEETNVMKSSCIDVVDADVANKRKDDGETVKLMQDIKESSKDLDVKEISIKKDSMSDLDHTIRPVERESNNAKLMNSEHICKRNYNNVPHISHSMRFKSRKFNPNLRTFEIPRRRKVEIMDPAGHRRRLRSKPIPTKQWAYMYRRRLVRQNAFCGSWPTC